MKTINILPPLLTRIGFNENDIKVYTSTLGLGKATIGELMVVTGMDPLTLVQTVNNLQELSFLKKIPGRTPQYFALLPFLKEYIAVERDALYSIDGIKNALITTLETYKEKKAQFGGKLDKSGDDHFFDIHIVSGLVKQLSDVLFQNYTERCDELQNSSNELLDGAETTVTRSLNAAMNQSLSFSIQLETYIQELEAFTKQFQHTASQKSTQLMETANSKLKDDFSNILQIICNGLDSHTDNHKESLTKLAPEIDTVLKDQLTKIGDIQNEFIDKYNSTWDESFNSWTNESRDVLENLSKNVNDLFSEQIKQTQELRRVVEQIDRNINTISSTMAETLHAAESVRGKNKDLVLEKLQEARDDIRNLANDLSESGLQLIDQHTLKLNDSNKLREELDHFELDSSTRLRTKKKQIVEGSIEKVELLPADILDSIQTETEKYAQSSFASCEEVTSQLKETVEIQMGETSASVFETFEASSEDHTQIIANLHQEVSSELNKSKQDMDDMGATLKNNLQNFSEGFVGGVKERQESFQSSINNHKEEMKKNANESKSTITTQIIEAEEMQIDTLISQVAAVIREVDESIMEQLTSLQEKVAAYYQIVNTREDELKQIDKAASSVEVEGQHNVSIVVGEEAIMASLTDIAMRAKREILIITPELDENLIKEMSQYTKASRVTLVSNFVKGKHQNALRSIKERFSGAKFKHYEKQDVYCGILDGFGEAVFAFLTADSTPVAIRTDNEVLLQMFKAAINRDVLFHSHDYDV